MSERPPDPDEQSSPVEPVEGARCAEHPSRDATGTCVRCGNYLCDACRLLNDAGLCGPCVERTRGPATAFAFDRESYTSEALLNLALAVWKRKWLPLALASIAFFALSYAPALLFEWIVGSDALDARGASELPTRVAMLRFVQQSIMFLLETAATLVLFGYVLDLLRNRPTDVKTALTRLRALPAQLFALLAIYVAVTVVAGAVAGLVQLAGGADLPRTLAPLFLLGLPPVVYAALGLAFVSFELANDPALGPIAALRRSWALASGKRWSVLNV
ncbi:MAG: hypothetical protein ABW321_07120, partial [Polyangiales bacterium]